MLPTASRAFFFLLHILYLPTPGCFSFRKNVGMYGCWFTYYSTVLHQRFVNGRIIHGGKESVAVVMEMASFRLLQ